MSETEGRAPSIWWFAFGYFACYVPYSALTKYLTKFCDASGTELLPPTAIASLVGMFVFLSAMRWWKHAGRRTVLGVSVPLPGRWTFMSGLCTAAIIPTTTLAYTFNGVSIVFMMLLMRGGVLILAPVVDAISRRRVRWFSWVALALSIGALLAAFSSRGNYAMTLIAVIDVIIYLAAYFVRLRFMSRLAKSDDESARKRYFVEEQMTATPVLVATLGAMALLGHGQFSRELAAGFTSFLTSGLLPTAIVVGLLSQGTGIFGGLILLDKRENTFCVPVNRASSVLAGLCASLALALLLGERYPAASEWVGASLILVAIAVLSIPPLVARHRSRAPASVPSA
jgi:general stress protein CsbA